MTSSVSLKGILLHSERFVSLLMRVTPCDCRERSLSLRPGYVVVNRGGPRGPSACNRAGLGGEVRPRFPSQDRVGTDRCEPVGASKRPLADPAACIPSSHLTDLSCGQFRPSVGFALCGVTQLA